MHSRILGIAVLIAGCLAGCSSGTLVRPSPTAPVTPAHLVIPAGAVPWAALPFVPYLPTPLPSSTPGASRQCGTSELSLTSLDAVGATGNDGVVVILTNASRTTCLAENYPRVTLDDSRHVGMVAISGGFFDAGIPIGDVPPGGKAAFIVSGSSACTTQPNPPHATRLSAVLPGGGTVSVALPGTYAPGSNGSLLTVPTACGVSATHLTPYPAPQTPPVPADPLAQLAASITAPASVIDGRPITYVVDLHNPGDQPVALSPCRGYLQTLDGEKTPSFEYELNCSAARVIPARGDEQFVIEMPQYTAPPGVHTVCWGLDADGSSKPPVCAQLTLLP